MGPVAQLARCARLKIGMCVGSNPTWATNHIEASTSVVE